MLELLAQTTQADQVRAFYTDAFYAVLTAVLAMVAIFGVAMPMIAGWLQRKRSAAELEQLRQKVRQEMDADLEQLRQGVRQEMDADRERLLQEVRQEMETDRERMLQEVRREMNLGMARTSMWTAVNAMDQRPEFSVTQFLQAAKYSALAGAGVDARSAVSSAQSKLERILRHPDFKGLTWKSVLINSLDELKEAVDAEGMGEHLDERIARIEESIHGAEAREENGGADAESPATEDD